VNVCGVLIHARPDSIDSVEAALHQIPGVESHGRAKNARLVVTVEDSEKMTAADALAELNALPGVVAAALVYHEFEPDEDAGTKERENYVEARQARIHESQCHRGDSGGGRHDC